MKNFMSVERNTFLYFVISLIFIIVLGSSCIPNKKLIYLPDPKFNDQELTFIQNQPLEYKLQPHDILSVKVKTLDEVSSAYFNIETGNAWNVNNASMFLTGYSINKDGIIEIPEVGEVNVGGKTLKEAEDLIKERLSVYLNKSMIIVKLISFKITVLGEVQQPGHYFIYNEQATVLEGLGMAGDLTDFGNRENITLIRKTANGSGTVLIDLKDPGLLASEFYYLQPNDIIYVQPMKAKSTRSNVSTLGILSVLFGAISSVVLLADYLR